MHNQTLTTTNGFGCWSDAALLGEIIGVEESNQYRGSLQPFFTGGEPNQKCTVARELVKRWLGEEMFRLPVFADPSAVKDFLKIHFADREYESFIVLFLDNNNRLIAIEELFTKVSAFKNLK